MRNPLDTSGFGAVFYKETRHIMRDRLTLIISFMLPVVQLIIFGYAINTKVEHVRTAVFNEDHGAQSVAFVDALRGSRIFDVVDVAASRSELERKIVSGTSRVAFDIPRISRPTSTRAFRPQFRRSSTGRIRQLRSLPMPPPARSAMHSRGLGLPSWKCERACCSIPTCEALTFWCPA